MTDYKNHAVADERRLRLTDRKRVDILNAAVTIFNSQGFAATSMDAIAEEAKVSKRTVYNHFESKDRLFMAIVDQLIEDASVANDFQFEASKPLYDQLFEFATTILAFYLDPNSQKLSRVIVSRFLQTPDLARQMFGNAKLFELALSKWITLAANSKQIKCKDKTTAARQFLALLETFVLWPQLLKNAPIPSKAAQRKIVDGTVNMFLDHYACKP